MSVKKRRREDKKTKHTIEIIRGEEVAEGDYYDQSASVFKIMQPSSLLPRNLHPLPDKIQATGLMLTLPTLSSVFLSPSS